MIAARTRPDAGHRVPKADPAGKGGGGGPDAPSAPPGSAASGVGGAAPGGLSSGVWCDIFIVLLAFTGQALRRHRVRPVLSGPIGVVSLLQRPG
jgi:hypothetical protein